MRDRYIRSIYLLTFEYMRDGQVRRYCKRIKHPRFAKSYLVEHMLTTETRVDYASVEEVHYHNLRDREMLSRDGNLPPWRGPQPTMKDYALIARAKP